MARKIGLLVGEKMSVHALLAEQEVNEDEESIVFNIWIHKALACSLRSIIAVSLRQTDTERRFAHTIREGIFGSAQVDQRSISRRIALHASIEQRLAVHGRRRIGISAIAHVSRVS